MAEIKNCTNRHIRLLRTGKNHRLEVLRCYPAGAGSEVRLEPTETPYSIGGIDVQPVVSVITNPPDMMQDQHVYLVDMDTAVSLAEHESRSLLLVPCDPFLVRKLPDYRDDGYAGEYDLVPGGLATSDEVLSRLDDGYEIYGYRRLLMVRSQLDDEQRIKGLLGLVLGHKTQRLGELAEMVADYYDRHKKRLDGRTQRITTSRREVLVTLMDETELSFKLDAGGVSQLMLLFDSLV